MEKSNDTKWGSSVKIPLRRLDNDVTEKMEEVSGQTVNQAINEMTDYVIEVKGPIDGSWYRKWKSGIIEQWGYKSFTAAQTWSCTITYPVAFVSSYYPTVTPQSINTTNTFFSCVINPNSKTGFTARGYGNNSSDKANGIWWHAIGK